MVLHPSLQSILSWLEPTTNLGDCYQLLELSSEASLAEIKASYQRLVQQYYSDNNLDQQAENKFIALTEAYELLVSVVQPQNDDKSEDSEPKWQPPTTKEEPTRNTPPLSETEQLLKWRSYDQLQQLLKSQRFPRAIVLVEGLAQRLPQDPQVREWQASAYQRWGHQLLNENQVNKARIYLKKALKTDPRNRSLWSEVEQDFRRMEKIF